MPEYLYNTIAIIAEKKQKKESVGFLSSFERLIDPVMMTTLFGLYKSQELPPLDKEEMSLDKSYEFNVDISSFTQILNHFLFCLWVNKNGLPDKSKEIIEYRKKLYKFVSKLLDSDYYRSVLIPFYLEKANESGSSETSFIYRLWNSDESGVNITTHSPEYLALEFASAQSDFIANIMTPLKQGS